MVFQVVDKFSHETFLAAFKLEKVKTDTFVFRLHYKLSIWLVLLYSLAYMFVQWKMPISCHFSHGDNIGSNADVLNDFCWVHGTYEVKRPYEQESVMSHPIKGITGQHDEVKYYHYYLWMYFFIAFMIILLYAPRKLWRCIENRQMSSLTKELNCFDVRVTRETVEGKEDKLAEYLFSHLGYHGRYGFGFALCEFLNVAVTCSLMLILDIISGHEFSMHGVASLEYMQMPPSRRIDPMYKVFPILGKCSFNKYGPSGNIIPYDGICVLPLNLINECAAVFFWYYFMILLAIGFAALVFRVVLMSSYRVRRSLLSAITPLTPKDDLVRIVDECSYSDWFVLYHLGFCVDPVFFREITEKFVVKLRRKGTV